MTSKACAIAKGKKEAAEEVLSVSQRELSRIQQQGWNVASASDRLVFRTPDYSALPWPLLTGPGVTLATDPNRKDVTAAGVNAEGFVSPFTEGEKVQRAIYQPAPNAPEIGFAATPDLAQLDLASFQGTDLASPGVYAKLASAVASGLDQSPTTLEAYNATVLPVNSKTGTPIFDENYERQQNLFEQSVRPAEKRHQLYGGAPMSPRAPDDALSSRVRDALRGALYDLMHLDSISEEDLRKHGCSSRVQFVLLREDRGPLLGAVCCGLVLLCALLLSVLWSSPRNGGAVVYYYS